MRFALLALTLLSAPTIAAPPREPVEEAVERGLLFLRRTQQPDGGWVGAAGMRGRGGESDPAVSALAVMAFLSAGHVPGEGKHGAAVEKGIRFVLTCQATGGQGVIRSQSYGSYEMYHHGICTLMLAEAAGMTEGKLADELRQRTEAAVKYVLAGQRKGAHIDGGGWRYSALQGFDADLSVTGWQVLALRASKNIGCDVPAERIASAVEYVRRCYDKSSGGFRYTTHTEVTVACTGTGIIALELCGKEYHKSKEVLTAGNYILKNNLAPNQRHFFYGVYYTSQAMFQLGDDFWKQYRRTLHGLLLHSNPPRTDGAWYGGGGADDNGWGPNYCTAMAILALTVEYRYLPIYQRFEEPIEKE